MTSDLSEGGVFLLTPEPPPVGLSGQITLELPTGPAILRLRGTVVRRRADAPGRLRPGFRFARDSRRAPAALSSVSSSPRSTNLGERLSTETEKHFFTSSASEPVPARPRRIDVFPLVTDDLERCLHTRERLAHALLTELTGFRSRLSKSRTRVARRTNQGVAGLHQQGGAAAHRSARIHAGPIRNCEPELDVEQGRRKRTPRSFFLRRCRRRACVRSDDEDLAERRRAGGQHPGREPAGLRASLRNLLSARVSLRAAAPARLRRSPRT